MEASEVLVRDVAPEQFVKLVDRFREEGGKVTGTDKGLVENECFAANFVYDADKQLVTLEPQRLVPTLTPRLLQRTVEQMMAPPAAPVIADDGSTIYKPTPHVCAVYNWAIGFFTNNSGQVLTYSGSDTEHGELSVKVSKIQPGDDPEKYQNGFWVNQSVKDSTVGSTGSISYQLADGVTTLTVTYDVNTLSTVSANAALSGTNAGRFTAVVDIQTAFYFAAAYLYPYVTLSKV